MVTINNPGMFEILSRPKEMNMGPVVISKKRSDGGYFSQFKKLIVVARILLPEDQGIGSP